MWFRSESSEKATPSAAHSRKSKKRRGRRQMERLHLETLESRCLLTFMAPVNYPAGPYVSALAAGDFANNGIQDLVTVNGAGYDAYGNGSSTVSILMGKGDGTFKLAVPCHRQRSGVGGGG